MNNTDDKNLVKNIKKSKCNQSLIELHSRHEKLCLSILYKLSKRFNCYFLVEEIKPEIHHIIYNSAHKYDSSRKTKFSTFLGNETKWAFFTKMNSVIKNNNNRRLNDLLKHNLDNDTENTNESMYDVSVMLLKNIEDHRIRKIFKLRYEVGKENSNKVMPWHEVGAIMNLSSQGCINLHSNGIKFIQEKLKEEGIHSAK